MESSFVVGATASWSNASYEYRTDRGWLRIRLAAPTVMVFEYHGHSDVSYAEFYERVIDDVFGDRDGLHFFIDCEAQTGFDRAFRKRIAECARKHEPRTKTYFILVRSRVVALGVALVSLMVGGKTKVVSTRAEFEAQLKAAIRRSLEETRSAEETQPRSSA